MRLTKKRSCRDCTKRYVCVLKKEFEETITKGLKLQVFAVYEEQAPLLSYQILNAVAAACTNFEVDTSFAEVTDA